MDGEVVEAHRVGAVAQQAQHTRTDRKAADGVHCRGIHPVVHKRGQRVIVTPHPDGTEAGRGHRLAGAHDAVQRRVQFQLGTDLDRHLQQLAHPVAVDGQFAEQLVNAPQIVGAPRPAYRLISVSHGHPRTDASIVAADGAAVHGWRGRNFRQNRRSERLPLRIAVTLHVMAAARLHCGECGLAFYGRADARYCCAACKQRAYRSRERRRTAADVVPPAAAVARARRIRREAAALRRRAQAVRRTVQAAHRG